MLQLSGLLRLTLRELWAKKIIIGLFIIATLVWVSLTFALNLDTTEGFFAGMRLYDQTAPPPGQSPPPDPQLNPDGNALPGSSMLEQVVIGMESFVAGSAYWIGTLLALFAAAPLFARLLESGHVDLLLSKPMSRTRALTGHILGILAMMLLLACYLIGSVWLVMSIKTGVWNPRFLLSIFVLAGMFTVLYGVVACMTIWTESTALSLIVTYGLIFVSIVLALQEQITKQLNNVGDAVFMSFYYLLPNFAEITRVVTQLSRGEAVTRGYALGSTALLGIALYLVAGFWFNRRDF